MPLDKDNASHRQISDNLDARFGGSSWYTHAARPIIHGAYHAGRYVDPIIERAFHVNSYVHGGNPAELARATVAHGRVNPEEWAQAKDQFSKVDNTKL